MIVIVGVPVLHLDGDEPTVGGAAGKAAVAGARAGADVQLVGKAGADDDGDRLMLALAVAGVGHVALLRDPARRTPVVSAPIATDALTHGVLPVDERSTSGSDGDVPALEAADVELALRYLTDFRVVVVAEPHPPEVVEVVADAARYASARLVLAVRDGPGPADAIVFQAPAGDTDGEFARFLGEYAAALDRGEDPGDAFRTLTRRLGWEPPAD